MTIMATGITKTVTMTTITTGTEEKQYEGEEGVQKATNQGE